jgi:flagellar hook-associated protein 2
VTSSVDGLVSGLSTSSLISQLMSVEKAPQDALKTKVTAENKVISAYQSVNTKMSSLKTAAHTLTLDTTWQAVKASSSSDAVVANASPGAPTGDVTFDVKALARAQVSTATAPAEGSVPSSIDISIGGGAPTHITVTTNTAQGLADAVNAAGVGVRASVVTTDQGTKLQFTGTKTGYVNRFSITGLGGVSDVVAAADARIQVSDPAAGGYTVSSATNSFANAIPGVTLTANRVQDGVTVSVGADADGMADKMQSMVDAANAALAEISGQSAYNATTKSGGPLQSDYTVRELAQNILGKVGQGQSGYGSFKQLGVELDRGGRLTFDRGAFLAAYKADPAKVKSAVQTGLAKTLDDVASAATDSATGSLTLAIQGGNSLVKNLNDQISDWDIRLQARQEGLQKQFASLEVALGKLKDQSSWLSGQIASLPSRSS